MMGINNVMSKAHERSERIGLSEKKAHYYESGYFDGYIEGQLETMDKMLDALSKIYGKKASVPDVEMRPIGNVETR